MSTVSDPETREEAARRSRIDRYLREHGFDGPGTTVVPLTGDASDRRYFRVINPAGGSIVLALHAGAIEFASLPFATVAELLRRMSLPVPAILGHSDELGILAVEDLGDVTLQAHLGAAPPTEHALLYRQAVGLIDTLQRRGADFAGRGALPYRLAFDVEKLTWELDFFLKHFLESFRGVALTEAERRTLGNTFLTIAEELAAEPRVLCHRDYHSRNLMVHGQRLYLIDFQDARMGPDTYDLVSLLRDSYIHLDDTVVEELMAGFLALKGAHAPEPAEFRRRFDLMAVQRNLKALGTFGYQATARRNPVYAQYVPRTLRYVRVNLERYSRFARLWEVLADHVEELR